MPNSLVRKAELKDNEIVLTVEVGDYMEGKSVEVRGYISQDGGTFYDFRETRKVANVDPGTHVARLTVTVPVRGPKFSLDQTVTVLTWVSDFWPSMLTADKQPAAGSEASWTIDQKASERWRSGW